MDEKLPDRLSKKSLERELTTFKTNSYRFSPTTFVQTAPNLVVPGVRADTGAGPEDPIMLWTIFVVLLVLWLLGVVSSYTLGGFIHILLVLALVALVFQLISGRKTTI